MTWKLFLESSKLVLKPEKKKKHILAPGLEDAVSTPANVKNSF